MTRIAPLLLLATTLLAAPLAAQIRPQPGIGDPRLQSVDFRANQIVLIEATPGYQVTIELAPDERIQTVALGDTANWQVTANRIGNQLFVKPLQTGANTNLTVVTDVRRYAFELGISNASTGNLAYTVSFRYPPTSEAEQPLHKQAAIGRYRLSGARALRPRAISDDGVHTYIDFPPAADLPATYVLDDTGRETLANGGMRDGFYVLDRVADRLVFRIDKRTAKARRVTGEQSPQ